MITTDIIRHGTDIILTVFRLRISLPSVAIEIYISFLKYQFIVSVVDDHHNITYVMVQILL